MDVQPGQQALPSVTIEYCTKCKWMLRAAYVGPPPTHRPLMLPQPAGSNKPPQYAQELLSTFEGTLAEVALRPAPSGTFKVSITTTATSSSSSSTSHPPQQTQPAPPPAKDSAPLLQSTSGSVSFKHPFAGTEAEAAALERESLSISGRRPSQPPAYTNHTEAGGPSTEQRASSSGRRASRPPAHTNHSEVHSVAHRASIPAPQTGPPKVSFESPFPDDDDDEMDGPGVPISKRGSLSARRPSRPPVHTTNSEVDRSIAQARASVSAERPFASESQHASISQAGSTSGRRPSRPPAHTNHSEVHGSLASAQGSVSSEHPFGAPRQSSIPHAPQQDLIPDASQASIPHASQASIPHSGVQASIPQTGSVSSRRRSSRPPAHTNHTDANLPLSARRRSSAMAHTDNAEARILDWPITKTLWDRRTDGGFPETKELKRRVRDVLEPERDLGHVDRVSTGKGHRPEMCAIPCKDCA